MACLLVVRTARPFHDLLSLCLGWKRLASCHGEHGKRHTIQAHWQEAKQGGLDSKLELERRARAETGNLLQDAAQLQHHSFIMPLPLCEIPHTKRGPLWKHSPL